LRCEVCILIHQLRPPPSRRPSRSMGRSVCTSRAYQCDADSVQMLHSFTYQILSVRVYVAANQMWFCLSCRRLCYDSVSFIGIFTRLLNRLQSVLNAVLLQRDGWCSVVKTIAFHHSSGHWPRVPERITSSLAVLYTWLACPSLMAINWRSSVSLVSGLESCTVIGTTVIPR